MGSIFFSAYFLCTGKTNKIFISWSGPRSKEIAKGIKWLLEDIIFLGTDLKCFVSDLDITSGSDWWIKIKGELKTCKMGLLCVTKENIKAPWIYFEAGAMIAREIPTTPILINCGFQHLSASIWKAICRFLRSAKICKNDC